MDKKTQRNTQNNEIDLIRLLLVLKKHVLLILAVGLLTGLLAGVYTHFKIPAVYSATSNMMITTKETTLASIADLNLGVSLTGEYSELITSRTALERVIENLNLEIGYKSLQGRISITNPTNTRILRIKVSYGDPVMAKTLADEIAFVGAEFITEQMDVVPPKVYETSEVPIYKDSPNLQQNVGKGMLAGMALVAGILVVLELLNDAIQSEEDVQRYLEIPVLAVVPDKGIKAKRRKSSSKKNK